MHEDFTPKRYTLDEILEEARAKREKVASKLSKDTELSSPEEEIDEILQSINKAVGKKIEVREQNPEAKTPREKPALKTDISKDTPFTAFAKKQKEKPDGQEKPGITPLKPEEEPVTPTERAEQKNEPENPNQTEAKKPAPIVLNAKPRENTRLEESGSKKITPPIFKDEQIEVLPSDDSNNSLISDTEKGHTRVLDDNLNEITSLFNAEEEPNIQSRSPEHTREWEQEFKKSRVKKISNFVLSGEEEEETDAIDWEEEELPEIEDYESPEDAPSVRNALNKEAGRLLLRTIITFLSTVALLLLLLLPLAGISFPDILFPEEPYLALLLMHTGLVLLSIAISTPTVFGGLSALLRFKPTSDSAVAAASVSVLAQSIAMLVNSSGYQNTDHLFGAAVALSLFINSMGKLYMVRRIRRNFDFVADSSETFSAAIMQDQELAQDLGRGAVIGGSVVAYPVKTEFLTRFIDISYREDYSQTTAKLLSILGVLGSIAAVLINFLFVTETFSPTVALSLLSASLCICIPIASLLSANMQLNNLSKTLIRQNALMAGFSVAEDFNEINAIAVNSTDLFPQGTIRLHGIKTFGDRRIDEAILDAAALVCSMGSPLTEVFDMVIQGRRDILPQVDSLVYEEDMGVSGWVAGRRVLVGNRRLMINHGIDVPSGDYEARYLRKDRNIVYLSTSGELSAMFIVSYLFSKKIGTALNMLEREGVALIVSTTDPNITASMLSEGFGISENSIKIMSPAESREYSKLRNTPAQKTDAGIAYKGPINALLRAVTGALRLNSNIRLISILQTISILIGYGVILFFALTSGFDHINALQILCYQIFWIVAIVFVPLLRKP